MSQKLLKAKKTKIAPKKDAVVETDVVLVGTYKEKQLAWIKANGIYNYPVKDGDELTDEACGKVKELWLYADVKSTRHAFAAEFMSKMSREEFVAAYPTYAKLGKPKNKAYYVFKAEEKKGKLSVFAESSLPPSPSHHKSSCKDTGSKWHEE